MNKFYFIFHNFFQNKYTFFILYHLIHANIFFAFIQKTFFKYFRYKKLLFCTNNLNIPFSHYSSFLFKTYEINDRVMMEKFITKKNKCIIVGTGIGFTTVLAYQLSKNKVLSLEIDERLKNIIEKNFSLNKIKYELIFKNISFNKKKLKSYFKLKDNFLENNKNDKYGKKIIVDNIYYKDLKLSEYNTMIIDAEGYEFEILTKVKKLKSIKNIFFELHPKILSGYQQKKLFRSLFESGYVKQLDFLNTFFYKKI